MIEPIDSLEIAVIVDNVTDNLSSDPKYVETEVAGTGRRGMKWLGGKCLSRRGMQEREQDLKVGRENVSLGRCVVNRTERREHHG